MQTEHSFLDEIKHQYKSGGMTMKLIFINVIVFLFIGVIEVFSRLIGGSAAYFLTSITGNIFLLHTDVMTFLTHPWGLFTSIFSHLGFMHLLWNMLFLYFSGKLFEQFFDEKRMLYTYILGGVFGGLLEIVAHLVFPMLTNSTGSVVGASGAVMAIMVSLAFYRPRLEVALFGAFKIRFVFLALFFILKDFLSLGVNDGVAHFAHLGGALLGILSIQNVYNSGNVIIMGQKIGDRIVAFFKFLINPKKNARVKMKKTGTRTQQFKTDEEYNVEQKAKQAKIDAILDKIAKAGYESLSKSEKDFLFQQSNK